MHRTNRNEHARRRFLGYFSGAGLGATLFPGVLWARMQEAGAENLSIGMMKEAAALAGLEFTDEEYELMVDEVEKNFGHYQEMRRRRIANSVPSPLYFNPAVPGMTFDRFEREMRRGAAPEVSRPADLEEAAFWPLTHLARLVETRQVTSAELTEMYLARLERLNPVLNCVVNLTRTGRASRRGRRTRRSPPATTAARSTASPGAPRTSSRCAATRPPGAPGSSRTR